MTATRGWLVIALLSLPSEGAGGAEPIGAARPHGQPRMLGALDGTAEVTRGDCLQLSQLGWSGAPLRLEARGVPAGEARAGLIGALTEREECRAGFVRGADLVVGEECEGAGPGLDPGGEGG